MNTSISRRAAIPPALALALVLTAGTAPVHAQRPLTLVSPNGRTEVRVDVRDGHLMYSVTRDHRALILPSMLGFEFRGAPPLRDSLRVTGSSTGTYDSTWTQPWGEVAHVRDHHNELRVSVAETSAAGRHFDVVVRAFDDGIGFRYEVPSQARLSEFEIEDEL